MLFRTRILMAGLVSVGLVLALPTGLNADATAIGTGQTTQCGVVSGTVLDASGKPVAGAKVILRHHRPGGTANTSQPAHHERIATTAAAGHFTFDNVHPGRIMILAFDRGVGHGYTHALLQPSGTVSVTVTLEKPRKGA